MTSQPAGRSDDSAGSSDASLRPTIAFLSAEPLESEVFVHIRGLIKAAGALGAGHVQIIGLKSGALPPDNFFAQEPRAAVLGAAGSIYAGEVEGLPVILLPIGSGRAAFAATIRLMALQRLSGGTSDSCIEEAVHAVCGPAPDLALVCGGLRSLAGALTWNAAYSEFAFCDEALPDLPVAHLRSVFDNFVARERRFGGLKAGQFS